MVGGKQPLVDPSSELSVKNNSFLIVAIVITISMIHSFAFCIFLFTTALTAGAISLRDFFASEPSFDGLLYGNGSSYTLHEIRVDIAVSDFQWVLLGFPRPCSMTLDNSPTYEDCNLALQGHSSKYIAFPKKRYSLSFKSQDDENHEVNLRNVRIDPTFSREKLFHDIVSAMGTTAIQISHTRLYINGEYNGLYVAAQTIDSYFMDENVNGINTTRLYYDNIPRDETAVTRMKYEYEENGDIEIEGEFYSFEPYWNTTYLLYYQIR